MYKTYRIGEVAALLNLKTYVLRFWETEFPQLKPLRTGKGQRLYTEEHVQLARRIQELVHEQGMTLDGARRILKQERQQRQRSGAAANASATQGNEENTELQEILRSFRQDLQQMRDILRNRR